VSEQERSGSQPDVERALAPMRVVALALSLGPLLVLGALLLVPASPPSRGLVAPAALAGLVALAIGYRLYRSMLARIAPGAHADARRAVLRTATIASLSVTESTALFGAVAFYFSREPFALAGLVSHLILAGAVWPTCGRLDAMP
jgi:protein-S-isoprenylcysteine O-methyltransferase Ste14